VCKGTPHRFREVWGTDDLFASCFIECFQLSAVDTEEPGAPG
jgi:hypothetical protein